MLAYLTQKDLNLENLCSCLSRARLELLLLLWARDLVQCWDVPDSGFFPSPRGWRVCNTPSSSERVPYVPPKGKVRVQSIYFLNS